MPVRHIYERESLDVHIRERGDSSLVIEVVGEVDSDNCAELRRRLADLMIGESTARVALDLAELTFIGSAGVRELLHCREAAERYGGHFEICEAHEHVRQVLHLCGLTELLRLRAA